MSGDLLTIALVLVGTAIGFIGGLVAAALMSVNDYRRR